MTGEMCLKRI